MMTHSSSVASGVSGGGNGSSNSSRGHGPPAGVADVSEDVTGVAAKEDTFSNKQCLQMGQVSLPAW